MGLAANIEYLTRVFYHNLYLESPYGSTVPDSDKQAINSEYVLKLLDGYNNLYGQERTSYGDSSFVSKQIADNVFVNYCADNGLKGNYIGTVDLLEGNNWSGGQGDNRTRIAAPFDCTVNISFTYNRIGSEYGLFPMFIRTIDTDGLTTINNPAGYFQGIRPINNLVVGSNNLLPVSLLEGQIIEAGCTGTQEGNRYGIIKDLIVNAFLKSNETFIKTSPQYSAKNGNNSYEIIAGPGTYTYSFFPRNNSSTGGAVNAKLIKFSYLSTSGTETVIYEPDSVPDEYGRAEIKGSVSFSTENMRFKMEVKKIGNNYGIVDCLTIKGTIP